MPRTALLFAAPAALLAWSWLRLEDPHVGVRTALWLIALALVPALLPRRRWRQLALVPASALALHAALGVWIVHPLRLLGRFGGGFLEFYDVRLPFDAALHPRMEGVILVALFTSCVLVALLVAARRPVLAALALLVAAGWPATLLTGPDDLRRGLVLLAVMLTLVFGLGVRIQPRKALLAATVGGLVVLAAFAASTSSAVASGQVLHWQSWDFYTKPPNPVGVEYVWNSNYSGLHFPKKVTTVLTIKAPGKPSYWRATTLDEFNGNDWYEHNTEPVQPIAVDGRDELRNDPEFPAGAGDSSKWVQQDVVVGALRDKHLIGASVPVAYASNSHAIGFERGGVAYPGSPLSPGDKYSVWSYQPQPSPGQLAALPARYPAAVADVDLDVQPGVRAPVFGAADRTRKLSELFARSFEAKLYEPLYTTAKRVVGDPSNPYAAALELEGWFRSGAFTYDETPPPSTLPLVDFVTKTRRGYCQHFAGAMALMLRYLGIPARVAAGFTSGNYDRSKGEWTVSDHDAHAWVEVWFPHYGWLPFDPTPGRSLDGSYTASSPHFDLTDGLRAVAQRVHGAAGSFNLRKLKGGGQDANGKQAAARAQAKGGSRGARIGALLRLLVFVGLVLGALIVAIKVAIRRLRYLTRDPRKLARASVRELTDYVADQGAAAPPSATLGELVQLVEDEIGVSPRAFVAAAAEARFGPAAGAAAAARRAREELRALRRELRASLTRSERALGLISLRSLDLSG